MQSKFINQINALNVSTIQLKHLVHLYHFDTTIAVQPVFPVRLPSIEFTLEYRILIYTINYMKIFLKNVKFNVFNHAVDFRYQFMRPKFVIFNSLY